MTMEGSIFSRAIGGTVLAACLVASGQANAYEQFSGEEGKSIEISYSLPSFPHEARSRAKGYSGVRYTICTSDGSAKGATWSNWQPESDYLSVCNWVVKFTSTSRFDKHLKLSWLTANDDRREGDEHFWVELTNPEVMLWGENTWQQHNGSHHVPSRIQFQLVIEDDD
ncbi:MAG: hypothetical protein OXF33_05925 [Rhodospirillales bacterium]|nr:hypothetical protein [Rhodospirillales bacterium]MCY4003223.1 hypothetical protein [Rhodospirillales bacterium]